MNSFLDFSKCNPYLFRRDLHSGRNVDFIEVLDRFYVGQREYFKTNNFSKVLRLEEYLEHCNLVYRVYLLEFDLLRSYDRSHIYI